MSKETKNNAHPEEGICEQFAYLYKLARYPNGSYMNELSEMPAVALEEILKTNNVISFRS